VLIASNEWAPVTVTIYKNAKIKKRAPNCVQKNIRYAASTHFRVLAKLYKIKNEGTNNISYDKKNTIKDEVKNIEYPAHKITTQ
jgi:hypothetical protein